MKIQDEQKIIEKVRNYLVKRGLKFEDTLEYIGIKETNYGPDRTKTEVHVVSFFIHDSTTDQSTHYFICVSTSSGNLVKLVTPHFSEDIYEDL